MSLDYKKIKKYLEEIDKIKNVLSENEELFDKEKLIEFNQITTRLIKQVDSIKNSSRKLSIGVVGAVKSGKSSFLNAYIFKGENYLPKAATPMTAALTKITYSDTPKAIIHFFTREDWGIIEEQSKMYDDKLQEDYNEYVSRISVLNPSTYPDILPVAMPMAKEEYEKQWKRNYENLSGAKELTSKADSALLNRLDDYEIIDGDIIKKLEDYVGADGYYTPIVSYVELQVNDERMKDVEIVDTPGLYDPIVSRGIRTKQFLRTCDVVLLLSPCSQFMDANMVNLMLDSLPNAGVENILVIGSKLDYGVLQESTSDFKVALKKSLNSYNTQFLNSITQARQKNKYADVLAKITQANPLFVSSVCFSINKKLKENKPLDSTEKTTYDNLHSRFKDFSDNLIPLMIGWQYLKEALEKVLAKKKEIIENKDNKILEDAGKNHIFVLDKILSESSSSRKKLETISAEELTQRIANIQDTIDSSREKLMSVFNYAVIRGTEKIEHIKPQLTLAMENHQKITVDTTTHQEHEVERTGILGLKKEIVYYDVVDKTANISSVISNIKQYSAKCTAYIQNEFQYIFDKERFSKDIINIVLEAFKKSNKAFDEQDILLPLQNLLAKISIPYIQFDYTKYIDEVETRFRLGYAKNEEIHSLNALQSRLLNKMESEIGTQLIEALENLKSALNKQAMEFADQIEGEFCSELKKISGQIEEKGEYIKKYSEFSDVVRKLRQDLLGISQS